VQFVFSGEADLYLRQGRVVFSGKRPFVFLGMIRMSGEADSYQGMPLGMPKMLTHDRRLQALHMNRDLPLAPE
jgi:hypothetical protein